MIKARFLFLAAMLALALLPVSAFADEILLNGSFENGMAYWRTSGNVFAHPFYNIPNPPQTVLPTDGLMMAVMSPYRFLDADMSQGFSTSGYKSVTISFDYNLAALDISRLIDLGTDTITVWFNGQKLASVPINDPWDGNRRDPQLWTVLGWQTYSQTFDNLPAGNFQIRFDLDNRFPSGDDGQNAVAFVDKVSFDATRIPEPNSLFLLGCGLLGLGVWTRKRIRK